MGWDETGIPVPGFKIPGWDRDEFSGISGIWDGTGMSFGKPGCAFKSRDLTHPGFI